MKRNRSAFTLLEVIIAMTLFALISIPTVALMSMSARKSGNRLGAGNASELISRIDAEVSLAMKDPSFDFSTVQYLYADEQLDVFDINSSSTVNNSDKYYRIELLSPDGYTFSPGDPYRIFVYDVIWPAYIDDGSGAFVLNANEGFLERMTLSSGILIVE